MRIETSDKTYLNIKNEYGQIINQPILVVAKTGGGKGLILEMIGEDYHNNDCVVIAIADPKQNCELAFQMFLPQERYHLDNLKVLGKEPKAKKVKIYHPFTYSIPKGYIPKYNFYTIPIKDLGDGEWSLLAETHAKSDAVTILEKASSEISSEDGIYGFGNKLREIVEANKKNKQKTSKEFSFLGSESGVGTKKDLSKIKGYLSAFEKQGFLSKKNSKFNLNWEKILTDQEHYHVFLTNFIDRTRYRKLIGFVVLNIIQSIIRNKKLLKKHLVILIPELKNLVPFKPSGFEEFLANAFTQAISTVRSEGISVVADTQVIGDIDRRTRDVFKVTLLGELTANDIDDVIKKFGLKASDYKDFLRKPFKRNTFVVAESDSFMPFTFFLPSAMHKEPIPGKYNFENMYLRHSKKDRVNYPMEKYNSLIKEIRDLERQEKKKFIDLEKKEIEELEKEAQKKLEEKEAKKSGSTVDKKIEKANEIQIKSKEMLMQLCWEEYQNQGRKSYRKVAEKFKDVGVRTHVTAKKYIDLHEEKLKQDESKDFADEFIEGESKENNE